MCGSVPKKTTKNSLIPCPKKSPGENSDDGTELRYASDTKMLHDERRHGGGGRRQRAT